MQLYDRIRLHVVELYRTYWLVQAAICTNLLTQTSSPHSTSFHSLISWHYVSAFEVTKLLYVISHQMMDINPKHITHIRHHNQI